MYLCSINLNSISMKTIYECSQSKGIKWFTLILFLIVSLAILVEIYYVSKGVNVTNAIIVTAILLAASFTTFLLHFYKHVSART